MTKSQYSYKLFFKDHFFETNNVAEIFDTVITQRHSSRHKSPQYMSWNSNTSLSSRYLLKYSTSLRGFKIFKYRFYSVTKALALNFTRSKFFPTLRTWKGRTYFFLSLGILAKFLQKGKSFTKSKTVYLLLASFLRKVMLYGSFKNLYLIINKTPLYFKEIMSTINDPVIKIYNHPFSGTEVNEKEILNPFTFPYIFFQNNKPYGIMKVKQKGRLKRKISKRLTLIGRVLD